MALLKSCSRLVGNSTSKNTFRCQKSLKSNHRATRQYANSGPPKPRPYNESLLPKAASRPLVGTKAPEQPQSSSPIPDPTPVSAPPPPPKAKAGGVAYPYLRISIGVLLCGSIIYSMVISFIYLFDPKLNYMHASSPRPSNSNPPPSLTETTSQSKSQA